MWMAGNATAQLEPLSNRFTQRLYTASGKRPGASGIIIIYEQP